MLTGLDAVFASSVITGHSVEFTLNQDISWLYLLPVLIPLALSISAVLIECYEGNTSTELIILFTLPFPVLIIGYSFSVADVGTSSTITSDIAPYSLVEKSQVEKVFEAELGDDIEFHAETGSRPSLSLSLSGDDYEAEAQEYVGEYVVSDVGDRSIRDYELRVNLDGEAIIEETSTDADQPAEQ